MSRKLNGLEKIPMLKRITRFVLLAVVLILATVSGTFAQTQNFAGHNWYFGNTTRGIKFSRSTHLPSLINNKVALNLGGSAVASDQINGNLLFYTDGTRVFNAMNAPMPNGNGLNGAPLQNQPVVITKSPDIENQFYIFHRDLSGEVFFSIVDMKLFGGAVFPSPPLGDVTATKNSTTGLLGMSEAMISIPHANGNDFWILTHAAGTTNYIATLVTNGGAITPLPPAPAGLITSAGNFSYHEGTGMIAVAPNESARNVEILRFDNATGGISFVTDINNSGTQTVNGGNAIYDTEWSNTGQYLYISRHHGETGPPVLQPDVLQFDTRSPATTLASIIPQPFTIFRSYGIQLAPDSLLYHLYQATSGGPFLLGSFANTDTVASEVTHAAQAFTGTFGAQQFASFAPADTVGFTLTFTTAGTCSNAPTTFFPTVSPAADSLVWDFGDGSPPVTSWSPVHTYTSGASFPVTVTAFLNGQATVPPTTQNVTITQFDLQITLVSDTTACSCELPLPKKVPPPAPCAQMFSLTAEIQGGTPGSMQWFGPPSLGVQTTATLTPQEAGYYYLVVRDGTNPQCFAYAGVNIREYEIQDQRANIWHFGQNAGIDFNPLFDNPPTAAVALPPGNGIGLAPLNTPEGSSVISDRNGQVILSTDGRNIFDKNGTDITPAPNPPGLGGESGSTQSALIVPVPGDETLFYIFTTQEVQGTNTYELRYSLFDLKENGGTGGLIEFNQLLFAKSTERITSNGNWLIAHEYGNNSFRAYQVTQLGISSPVISSIGSDHSFSVAEQGQGYMELGGNNQLAVALSTPGVSNVLEIFDFVDSSGVVTNFQSVNLKINTGQVYGIEFSGGKIFASIKAAGNTPIVEVFFDTNGVPRTVRQQPPMTIAGEAGAIQTGPDGTIYVAVNNSTSLATIQPNPDSLVVSTFTQNGFPLAGGTQSKLGLPNFIQVVADPVQTPGIGIVGICEDDSVGFSGTPRDNSIDTYFWQIKEAGVGGAVLTTSTDQAFRFFFTDPGDYEAILRLHNRCGPDLTLTRAFTIFAKPPIPGGPFSICATNAISLDANPSSLPGLTYLWSTAETTQTISVNRGGQFTVDVTNASGCASNGQFLVSDNRPVLDLGPDETICSSLTIPGPILDAQNPAAGNTYAWTITNLITNVSTPGNTTQTQPVAINVAGVFEYEVAITIPGPFGCTRVESKVYTINATPTFTPTPVNPTSCGGTDGSIAILFQTPPSALFSWSVVGPVVATGGNQATGSSVSTGPILSSGLYTVTVSDQVTGCPFSMQRQLSMAPFTATITQQNNCDPFNISVATDATGAISYRLFDGTGAQVTQGNFGVTTPTFTIPNVSVGTYTLTLVQTSTSCTFTTPPLTIAPALPLASITNSTFDGCTNPITVSVTGAATNVYTWTGPNITGGAGTASITATPPQGPQTYNLHITGAGVCPNDVQITGTVSNNVVTDWTQSDPCSNQVTLTATATPAGSYTYNWFRAGVAIAGGQSISVSQADNGILYRVDATNSLSGCTFASIPKAAQVAGVLTAQANFPNPIPCENTQFVITTTVNQPGATFRWFYNGSLINGQVNSSLTDTRGGDYTAEVSLAGCVIPADITIVPAPADPGLLPDNALICPDLKNPDPNTRQVTLDAGIGFDSYEWFKDEVATGDVDQTIIVAEEGLYSVELINVFGCVSSDQTQVDIECDPRLLAPTAFRPASDVEVGGEYKNREFKVFTYFISVEDFQVYIFNRWGEMIFQSNDRDFTWNGGYNNTGPLLPAGTYSYVIRYKSEYRPEDGIKEQRGGVVLVR